jgi:hypothetical protein
LQDASAAPSLIEPVTGAIHTAAGSRLAIGDPATTWYVVTVKR